MSTPELEVAKQRMLRDHLERRGIRDQRVLEAMARVPRERFLPEPIRQQAYADRAMAIGCGQTISQPFIVGLMTQALQLSGRETVLEIGTGSGYQTAILAELGRDVVSLERHAELSAKAGDLLNALGYGNVTLQLADGIRGWAERAPYDRIIVTAAAARCPDALFEQLAEGGILVIPLGKADHQVLQEIHKINRTSQSTPLSRCRFVPLVGAQ